MRKQERLKLNLLGSNKIFHKGINNGKNMKVGDTFHEPKQHEKLDLDIHQP